MLLLVVFLAVASVSGASVNFAAVQQQWSSLINTAGVDAAYKFIRSQTAQHKDFSGLLLIEGISCLSMASPQYSECSRVLSRAAELDPSCAQCRHALGSALLSQLGRVHDAIASIKRAIELMAAQKNRHSTQDQSAAHHSLAKAFYKNLEVVEAIEALEKSVALNPQNTDAQSMLAWIHLTAKNYRGALSTFRAAVDQGDMHSVPGYAFTMKNLLRGWYDGELERVAALIRNSTANPIEIHECLTLEFLPIGECYNRGRIYNENTLATTMHNHHAEITQFFARKQQLWRLNHGTPEQWHIAKPAALYAGLKNLRAVEPRFLDRSGRLKILYLHGNYYSAHSLTANVLSDMFQFHERKHLNISCGQLVTGDDFKRHNDTTMSRIRQGCLGQLLSLTEGTNQVALATRIMDSEQLSPAIMIDLGGMQLSKEPILWRLKPAPIQVIFHYIAASRLLQPGLVDYIVSDRWSTPVQYAKSLYRSEKLVLLPHTYFVTTYNLEYLYVLPSIRLCRSAPQDTTLFPNAESAQSLVLPASLDELLASQREMYIEATKKQQYQHKDLLHDLATIPTAQGWAFAEYFERTERMRALLKKPFVDLMLRASSPTAVPDDRGHDDDEIHNQNDRKRTPTKSANSDTITTTSSAWSRSKPMLFCTFNMNHKFTPRIFRAWMEILRRVPGSYLWVLDFTSKDHSIYEEYQQLAQSRLKSKVVPRYAATKEFKAFNRTLHQHESKYPDLATAGMPRRILHTPLLPLGNEELFFKSLCDIYLDTDYYAGHTSLSQALYLNIPTVHTSGSAGMQSRVPESVLHDLDLPELIAADHASYIDIAVRLAHDPILFRQVKEKLALRFAKPPFNAEMWTKAWDRALLGIWELHHAGLPAHHMVM